ncbi:MAG: hypothetical protein JOZ47_11785 [Kutzneria sp.]|nr:hypothetical protein [Kutzneria sp.]MBV9845741.1 hypothetical protein [Kutzneria sp.]
MVRRLLTPKWLLLHALAVVAMLACFRLGWWQWDRANEADGSLQNLGYALQWPLFGLFVPFMYWRTYRLESARSTKDPEPEPAPVVRSVAAAPGRRSPTEWRAAASESEPDAVLTRYNDYLAELNQRAEANKKGGARVHE